MKTASKKLRIVFIAAMLMMPALCAGASWNEENLQKIDKTKSEISFAVFADTRDAGRTLGDLVTRLNEDRLDFAIVLGDLVTHGRMDEFDYFLGEVKAVKAPLLAAIGNHETYSIGGKENYVKVFGPAYYSFAIDGAYFIVMGAYNETGMDRVQINWLKQELDTAKAYRNRFVFMHLPLYDPRDGDNRMGHSLRNLKLSTELNRIFDSGDVTMLFCSHIHGYFTGQWGKTPYTITGGGGVQPDGNDPSHYFHHYIRVTIKDGKPAYEAVRVYQ